MGLLNIEGCTSKQTFCEIACEAVKDMMENDNEFNIEINNLLPNVSKRQLISPTLYNNVKSILNKIYNYGTSGKRNPTEEKINEISDTNQYDLIYYNNYNKILQILDQDQLLSGVTLISQQLINDLQTYIKNYKFNNDRCNYCNISCNYANSGGGCSEPCTTSNQYCGCEYGECGLSESGCGMCQDGQGCTHSQAGCGICSEY